MLKILVDTCVWLDLAKDPKQSGNLRILEELVRTNAVELFVPQVVLDEFARNKVRVTEENAKSIASTLKRAKDIIVERGDAKQKRSAIRLLNEVDYKEGRALQNSWASVHTKLGQRLRTHCSTFKFALAKNNTLGPRPSTPQREQGTRLGGTLLRGETGGNGSKGGVLKASHNIVGGDASCLNRIHHRQRRHRHLKSVGPEFWSTKGRRSPYRTGTPCEAGSGPS